MNQKPAFMWPYQWRLCRIICSSSNFDDGKLMFLCLGNQRKRFLYFPLISSIKTNKPEKMSFSRILNGAAGSCLPPKQRDIPPQNWYKENVRLYFLQKPGATAPPPQLEMPNFLLVWMVRPHLLPFQNCASIFFYFFIIINAKLPPFSDLHLHFLFNSSHSHTLFFF